MTRPEDKTILIVDDEPDIRAYFAGILERAGFEVVTAADGEEALEAVKRRKPDFISLDLVMPRKSGIRFLYELRKSREWARIPIMIVTAHARDDLGREDFDQIFSGKTMFGPLTYLEKPVSPERFLHHVRTILGLEPAGEEQDADAPARLRREIESRLGELDVETLQRIRSALERNPEGGG
jgi:CheY-like chemotaxis protein